MQSPTCMTKGRGYWEVGRSLIFVGVTMSHVSVTVCFRMGCVLSICCRLSTLCMTEFGYAPIPSRRVGNSPPSEIPVPIIYLHPNKFIRRTKTQRCATAHPTETIPTIPHDISWMIVLPWLLLLNGFFHGVVIVTWNLFFREVRYAVRRRRLQPRTGRAMPDELCVAAPWRCFVRGQSPPSPRPFAFSEEGITQ